MMKPDDPRDLATNLLARSTCSVKVAAVVEDAGGHIISWGWNNVGKGFGQHAEAHALARANKHRVWYGTIYVASERARNSKTINSKPCEECQQLIDNWHLTAWFRDADGKWKRIAPDE